ncbi:MAG: hypothetical protein QXN66_03725 [Thermoplasmatales archaeon]
MDVFPGITALVVSIITVLFLRALILRRYRRSYKKIYRNMPVSSVEGLTPGIMTYLISIITAIIGPFSFRLYPLTPFSYVILNLVAGIFFSLTYPYFSPVTTFSTVDVLENKGKTICIAGKLMGKKLEVVSIKKDLNLEIDVHCGRGVCSIVAPNPDYLQKSS